MWTQAGPGRWTRDDGNGYLVRRGDVLAEVHFFDGRAIVHRYRYDPVAAAAGPLGPPTPTGGPLDDCVPAGTEEAVDLTPQATRNAPDAAVVWTRLEKTADTTVRR